MSVPFQSLSLEDRVTMLEAHVRRLQELVGPLQIREDVAPGEPLKPLEYLAHFVGVLEGRLDVLEQRVARLEWRAAGDLP